MNSRTMKAQILESPNSLQFREVDVPEIGPTDVLIRVRVCGISTMDHRLLTGKCRADAPLIPGNEVLGTVEAMGASVRGLEVGDRICVDSGFQTGAEIYEKQGTEVHRSGSVSPCLGLTGGLAEFMSVPAERCFRAPEQVDDYSATQAGSILQAFRALRGLREMLQQREPHGACIVILGARAGLLLSSVVRFLGFTPVVVTGKGKENLDALSRMGADVTIHEEEEMPSQAVWDALGGHGADAVIDVRGKGAVRPEAAELLAQDGRLFSLRFPDTADLSTSPQPEPEAFPALFKLLRYERINPRPAFVMAVPLERSAQLISTWGEDAKKMKTFAATSLREEFLFEHYRSPVDATLYAR